MKTVYLVILALILPWLVDAAVPAVRVRHYDEHSGLSHRSVKQIVQDRDGYIWFATWNGLNRFDGYEFTKIKPGLGDEARRYSDRIGDIKLLTDGSLLCRVDGRPLIFDTRTYKFSDLGSQLESRLGALPDINQIRQTTDGKTVLVSKDDPRVIVFADSAPVATARLYQSMPELKFTDGGNHQPEAASRYPDKDLVYSGQDTSGNMWMITRQGDILCDTPADSEPQIIDRINTHGEKLLFSTIDRDGNIWLRSGLGAYCVSMYELPYKEIADGSSSRVRALMRDGSRRIWIGDAGESTITVYDDENLANKVYISGDGAESATHVNFGAPPYAIASDKSGNIWVGTKPGGLHRLRPDGSGLYSVDNFTVASHDMPSDDVYDIKCDRQGRLWVATLGGGIVIVNNPDSAHPEMVKLIDCPGFPAEAVAVRSLCLFGDTLVLAATRGGLLAVKPGEKMRFRLHTSEPDRETSLSNIATMDIVKDRSGRIFVATESGGVDMLLSDLKSWDSDFEFRHFNEEAGIPSDIAVALVPDISGRLLWVVSDNMIFSFDPVGGKSQSYPSAFKGRKLRFAEGSPLNLGGNRWLVGHDKGCLLIDLDKLVGSGDTAPIVFTSVSVQNGAPRLLSPSDHEITLGADERNITLRFSALEFVDEANIRYEFRIDGGEWMSLGHDRSVSFLDLSPGKFTLEVRSTDTTGRWLNNAALINIKVVAKFHETWIFRLIIALLILGVIGAVAWVTVYIRRINARQRETLAAYLNLLDKSDATQKSEAETEPAASVAENISGEDAEFMAKVMAFVNSHLSDSEVGVGDMADYVAVSRSGLTRKLKSILGVTPSEFLKESRLSRASSLLTTTSMPIKDIAVDCGFADLNYFGKCFKSAYGVSPTHYRRDSIDKKEEVAD